MNGHRKRTGLTASGIAAALSCVLFFSCNNEDYLTTQDPEKACDNICFGVSPDESVRTRGGDNGKEKEYTSDHFVLRSQDSADTLCVRAIVSEGISTAESDTRKVITRGAPLTEDNFDKFHVLAYWKKDGSQVDQFYMNEDATKKDDIWSTDRTYYWPGAAHKLQFYAWAPVDAEFTSTPTSPTETSLTYTVPAEASNQKDIVVAKTAEINGDKNASVPLTFQHICTAVRFAVGNEMQSGTIKSVALKGVKNGGVFDMETSAWTLNETTANYTQTLNKSMAGNETNGTEITSAEGTFMMLPQILPDNAMVEVVFDDGITGHDRLLSASIATSEWKKGTTVTYKLSITPEYDLQFVSQPEVQDAHYVIYPITIHIGETTPIRSCVVKSTNPAVTIQDAKDMNDFDRQGYWIEADRGSEAIEVSGVSGDFTVYAYVEENVTDAPRDITIELYPQPGTPDKPVDTFIFTQLCPKWIDNSEFGCERLEDDEDYPWGFLWDQNMKITYDVGNISLFSRIVIAFYIGLINNDNFVSNDIQLIPYHHHVVFDFSQVPSPDVAKSQIDGQTNTSELYNWSGVSSATDLMDYLVGLGAVIIGEDLPLNPNDFAAKACMLKNKFRIEIVQQGRDEIPIVVPESYDWYLPAMDEAPLMEDTEYPLSGTYWTSTAAETEDEHSYKYTVGGSTELERRDVNLHVRAVRKKPQS